MADQPQDVPERPQDNEQPAAGAGAADGGAGAKGPSKSALKKAAKEQEKAEKRARVAAEEAARKKADEATDVSKEDYGELPMVRETTGPRYDTLVELAAAHEGQDITPADVPPAVFRAAVLNARNQSAKLSFLTLAQQENTIQAVVAASDTLSKQMVKFAGSIPTWSEVLVHGMLRKPKEPVKSTTVQHLEVHVTKLYLLNKADSQLPLQVADCEGRIPAESQDQEVREDGTAIVSLDTRLNNRTLDLTANLNHSILKIRSGVKKLFRDFLEARGFLDVDVPELLGAATEGGASVFEVRYFDKKGYLAQSPQFYKQRLIAARYERVMMIGHVFRSENSNTNRHLTEFVGLDLEMAFDQHYHEVVSLLENLFLFIFHGLNERYQKETEHVRTVYHVEPFKLPEAGKVPRLEFKEGIQMLRDAGEEVGDYDDLSTPHEKKLGALVLEKYQSDFYVLDQYPLEVRPWYTMPTRETQDKYDPQNPNAGYSNSYDFFMRGQEIMSGAQRIHKADFLEKRMQEHPNAVDPKHPGIAPYVDAFRQGCPPHAGGGIGLERIVMLWLGLPNVRLATAFPSDPRRLP